jgi:hypothetical protein
VADDVGEVGHHVAAGGRADTGPILTETRSLRGDRDVAEIGEVVAAADAPAVDARDHRLRAGDDDVRGIVNFFLGAPFGLPVHIATGREGAVAGTREYDGPDILVVASADERMLPLVDRILGECIQLLGTVDRDCRDVLLNGIQDVSVITAKNVRGVRARFHLLSLPDVAVVIACRYWQAVRRSSTAGQVAAT